MLTGIRECKVAWYFVSLVSRRGLFTVPDTLLFDTFQAKRTSSIFDVGTGTRNSLFI